MGLVPALLVLTVVTLVPMIYLVLTSLTPLNLVHPQSAYDFSHPLQNYLGLLQDPDFINSVVLQVWLSVATVVLQLLIGVGLALLLNVRSRFMEALRTGFLVPMVLPPIVVAIIWKILYSPQVSPIHRSAAALGVPFASLITNPHTALWAIAVADTWEWFPFTMLMVLAALQMMPNEPLEAAQIDGASRFQTFRYIILPFIMPAILVAGMFRLIDSIKAFPLIFLLTSGGPGTATQVTNYYDYIQTFTFSYWGYGAAIATVMVAGVMLVSWIIHRLGFDEAADV